MQASWLFCPLVRLMNLKSAIESILFLHGEPMGIGRLARLTAASKGEILTALEELGGELNQRGIVLIQTGEEWQLVTNPENKEIVEELVSGEFSEELSKISLEVLSIIAYKGPLSRAKIEYIRGVNSDYSLRNLLIRGLVGREENPRDRRSYLYSVSTDFLKHLGLKNLEALPHYDEFRQKEIIVPDVDGEES